MLISVMYSTQEEKSSMLRLEKLLYNCNLSKKKKKEKTKGKNYRQRGQKRIKWGPTAYRKLSKE